MKLSQKKNCNGCKAGWYDNGPFKQHCHFSIKIKNNSCTATPLEPCYKPITNDDYMKAIQLSRCNHE